MINLIKKENINIGILETDFDIFYDIVNTFDNEKLKQEYIVDLDDYILPEYFKNRITIVLQTNDILIGYTTFEFKNKNNSSEVEINKLFVDASFKNKMMEQLLIESVIYVSGEVGARNVTAKVNENDTDLFNMYQSLGFYETSIHEDGSILSVNVSSIVASRKLNEKFRDIEPDSIDYKSLKLVKKLASGRDGNIYLTDDGKVLKMFKSTSFTFIKDREETLKYIKKLDVDEVVKPTNLVYYDGIFVGYIMEYLPEGNSLATMSINYSFEEKLEKIKKIEDAIKKLHSKKVYVCDLNPDNIFFNENGEVRLIDCDSFVVNKNIINQELVKKYQDPIYKLVSDKTDMYAFAVTCLELLTNEKIKEDANVHDIEKIYSINKSKLPTSFKNYFEIIFKTKDRYYLSESYEKYMNGIYDGDVEIQDDKKGNISVIILSIILFVIAIVGYLVFKFKIN